MLEIRAGATLPAWMTRGDGAPSGASAPPAAPSAPAQPHAPASFAPGPAAGSVG